MKKFTAYALIVLLLLNVMGYYGVFLGIKYSHNAELTQHFDSADFDAYQSITIKVPLTVPYYGDTKFERINGEIDYEGETYRLVKQKYQKDTLYIVCVRDVESKAIKQALADYVKTFSEHSSDGMTIKSAPGFIKDYISTPIGVKPSATGWKSDIQFGLTEQLFKSFSPTRFSPPPEALSGIIS